VRFAYSIEALAMSTFCTEKRCTMFALGNEVTFAACGVTTGFGGGGGGPVTVMLK